MAWIQERRWAGGAKVAWQVREKSLDSGKIVVIKTFKTEREANKFLQSGEATPSSVVESRDARRLTVAQLSQLWLDAREKGSDGEPPLGRAALDNYESMVKIHIVPRIGGRIAIGVRPSDAKAYRAALIRDCSKPQAREIINRTRQMFGWFVAECDSRTGNPFAEVRIRVGDEDRPERIVPEHAQVKMLLLEAARLQRTTLATASWRQHWRRSAPMIWMMALVGPRLGEVRGASWPLIDLDAGVWRIEQAADRFGAMKGPKTRAGRRTLKLPPVLVDMLREWRKHCPISPGQLVFPTRSGRPVLQCFINASIWRPLMQRCGYVDAAGKPLFAAYSLRHFKLSDDIMRGDDIKEVQARSGHARAATLLDTYAKSFKGRAAREEGDKAKRLSGEMGLVYDVTNNVTSLRK